MEKKIRIYRPDGTCEDRNTGLTYDELVDLVGGYLEVHNFYGVSVVCNEDGKRVGLKYCRTLWMPGCTQKFVGTVCTGMFTEEGLQPVDESALEGFHIHFRREG